MSETNEPASKSEQQTEREKGIEAAKKLLGHTQIHLSREVGTRVSEYGNQKKEGGSSESQSHDSKNKSP